MLSIKANQTVKIRPISNSRCFALQVEASESMLLVYKRKVQTCKAVLPAYCQPKYGKGAAFQAASQSSLVLAMNTEL